ncbi:DUF4148 domain-containing protein [Herbaspirillum sp. RV1423]|uniref:DUF4148 domain-containing protein n=1 Tax=Herbaspirillum sp. RV1423 TaxID=1443993 RepID=UPI0004AE9D29|nr:DUF4148 domain-containing protein [Herbaspirillum sp. RV1423]
MNIKKISAAVFLLSLAGAVLAEAPYPEDTKFVSTKTRAEVIAELAQARANGELPINDVSYPDKAIVTAPVSTKTRAQVLEELKQYQQAHANPGDADMMFLR